MTTADEILKHKIQLELGTLIEESFENFKKTVWISGLALILLTVMICAIYFGIFALFYGLSNLEHFVTTIEANKSEPIYILINIILSSVSSAITYPIFAGFIDANQIANQNKVVELSDYFSFYKGKHVKDLILQGIILGCTNVLIGLLFDYIGYPFIGILIQIIIGLLTVYATTLIIYQNLNYWQSITISVELFIKNPFTILVALLVGYIIAMFGIIALCIGIFFTLPYIWSMYYAIYSQSFGREQKSEIDEIGTSFE